jgi:hypothetical protein
MTNHPITSKLPLTQLDQEALSQIFEQLKLEDIQLIKTSPTYSFALLEPWEEQGWIINSSLPARNV